MKDLESGWPLVSIRREGTPIAMGYLQNGTTYAPLRKVAESLGYTVKWDEVDYTLDLVGSPVKGSK